ncbi:MAG: hypothetical protein ACXU71_14070 [Croceibacterium sp.]
MTQFRFLPDGNGLKCCPPTSTRALVRLVRDKVHAEMWRVVRADGSLSDLMNKTRAREAAAAIAATFVSKEDLP